MSLLGWGSLALGAYSAYQGTQAQSDLSSSMGAQTAISQEALNFQKEQYARILDVYGSTEQNLSEYYKSLTPEKYKTMGLDAYDKQFQEAQSAWDAQMAQRGLSGSGIEAEGVMSMNMQATQNRAGITQQADQQWASNQMGWLALGTGQQNVAAQGLANSQNNMSNMYGNQASIYGSAATSAGQGVGNLINNAMYAESYRPGTMSLWG